MTIYQFFLRYFQHNYSKLFTQHALTFGELKQNPHRLLKNIPPQLSTSIKCFTFEEFRQASDWKQKWLFKFKPYILKNNLLSFYIMPNLFNFVKHTKHLNDMSKTKAYKHLFIVIILTVCFVQCTSIDKQLNDKLREIGRASCRERV